MKTPFTGKNMVKVICSWSRQQIHRNKSALQMNLDRKRKRSVKTYVMILWLLRHSRKGLLFRNMSMH